MLQRTITIAAKEGIKNIQIGMAHRGRLNVLTQLTASYHLQVRISLDLYA
jgi:2-oxoglutarate dehydrogenase complex dehydrogenase (E1) component-like enzyme